MDIREQLNYRELITEIKKWQFEIEEETDQFETPNYERCVKLGVFPVKHSPIKIHIELNQEDTITFCIWITVRTTSHMYNGERSDLHDLISTFLVILLKGIEGISIRMLDYPHPVLDEPSEIYARIILFNESSFIENQLHTESIELLNKVFALVVFSMSVIGMLVKLCPNSNQPNFNDNDIWPNDICNILGEKYDYETHNYMKRGKYNWQWFNSVPSGLSVLHFEQDNVTKLKKIIFKEQPEIISGVKKEIMKHKSCYNTFDKEKLNIGEKVLRYFDRKSEYQVICIDNKFFILGSSTIVCLYDDCSSHSVAQEKQLIKERQLKEMDMLFKRPDFRWSDNINGSRFENFIREILLTEPNITRIRQVSTTYEGDGGRDFEMEYLLSNISRQDINVNPYKKIKVIVQCKAFKTSVGKGKVIDIRDTIDKHNADGYFLIVSSYLTRDLFDYLSILRERGDYFIDWWDRNEIEDRLMKFPEIAEQYQDIVNLIR